MALVVVLLAAYLLGSIPFSLLIARWFGVADVRKVGSGNVGAANVMRAAGRIAGAFAFILDFTKGTAATLLALTFAPADPVPAASALAAVLGHMFPVWLSFRGGKGVATGAGAFLPLAPLATVIALAAFGAAIVVTRYSSVSSMTGTLTLVAGCFLTGGSGSVRVTVIVVAALIFWRHRTNLERLARGTEPRVGGRAGGLADVQKRVD